MGVGSPSAAFAFAPGHVTAAFRPRTESPDPRGRGSEGVGLVLELGVRARARFTPSRSSRLDVTSDLGTPLPISTEVARRLLSARKGRLEVQLTHELPVGQGFGMSAAGALATALAVARLLGTPRRRAVAVAHLADLFGGGGLGGVAAILGGGYEIRRTAGIPPWGDVVHGPFLPAVLLGVVGGPIPSPSALRDPRLLARIETATSTWSGLDRRSAPEELFAAGERFTRRVRLDPPRLRAALRGLHRRGAFAFQAMFGESFVALPRSAAARRTLVAWLADLRIPVVELRAARVGARCSLARDGP